MLVRHCYHVMPRVSEGETHHQYQHNVDVAGGGDHAEHQHILCPLVKRTTPILPPVENVSSSPKSEHQEHYEYEDLATVVNTLHVFLFTNCRTFMRKSLDFIFAIETPILSKLLPCWTLLSPE